MKPDFRVYFNERKQWFDVYVSSSPRKFIRVTKSWAYYMPMAPRKSRRGLFGAIHFSRVGSGLVAHELLHLLLDWIGARGKGKVTPKNEERIVTMFGEMTRMFWVRYYHWKEHTSI